MCACTCAVWLCLQGCLGAQLAVRFGPQAPGPLLLRCPSPRAVLAFCSPGHCVVGGDLRVQFYAFSNWPGGLFVSPRYHLLLSCLTVRTSSRLTSVLLSRGVVLRSMLGTRPGGCIAAGWASLCGTFAACVDTLVPGVRSAANDALTFMVLLICCGVRSGRERVHEAYRHCHDHLETHPGRHQQVLTRFAWIILCLLLPDSY